MAALAVGFKVFRVVLGVGQPLFVTEAPGFAVRVNTIPVGGATVIAPESPAQLRLRLWAFRAAGPASHFAVIAALVAAHGRGGLSRWLPEFFLAHRIASAPAALPLVGFANLAYLAATLIPSRSTTWRGRFESDGYALFSVPFLTCEAIVERLVSRYLIEAAMRAERRDFLGARDWYDRGLQRYPASVALRVGRASVDVWLGNPAKAREQYLSILEKGGLPLGTEALIWNNVAWADFLLDRAALKDEADRYSRQAVIALPYAAYAQGTRGAVLLWLGQTELAIQSLKNAWGGNRDPQMRALNACCLAMAAAALGRPDEGAEWLAKAKSLDAESQLLERAAGKRATAKPPDPHPS